MDQTEQEFLDSLDKKLWNAADKLRSNLDAAVYKHAVLGLIFIKYVSDAFEERRAELEANFRDPEHEYYLGDDEELIAEELEVRDYYAEKNVFWVPEISRWRTLQDNAKLPLGTEIIIKNGEDKKEKMRSVGWLVDTALDYIERDNPKLKGVLNKNYTSLQLEPATLGELIDLIASIPFKHESLKAKDILGHVYEYFLGQFALAEGKKGGQYFTPKAIVTLIVEMLQPYHGRVFDPAMGSGGFFVQSEKFIEEHGGKLGNISVYGQESNPTTWRLAAMNMAIRGIDFNFGGEPANSFSNNKHPDLRADFMMANPPFNMKEWNSGVPDGDPRWQYGLPPAGNANFAWMQHMLYHLAPNGSMGLLLANGSMSSNASGEGEIRRNLVETDLVECMVALPGQLFTNTQIPACIWFLTKNKKEHNGYRDRCGEILFIDARNLGYMKDRVLRDFTTDDIQKIAGTFHAWRKASSSSAYYASGPGSFSLSSLDEDDRSYPLSSLDEGHRSYPHSLEGEGQGEGAKVRTRQTPPQLIEFARQLRRNQTDAESMLWQLLRNRQIANCKFRRQHPAEPYILDFYCHEKKLAVELDGSQHIAEEGKESDRKRTAYLRSKGIRVLRFWNDDVLQNVDGVLEVIYITLTQTLSLDGEGKSSFSPGEEGQNEGVTYSDIPGFCKSVTLEEIKQHDYVLTPGRYVGAAEAEDDGEPFAEKLARLTTQLKEQFEQSEQLQVEIRENLSGLGFDI